MVKDDDDKNSICSNEEEVEVKDKETPKKKVLKKVVRYVIGNESDSDKNEEENEDKSEAEEEEEDKSEAEEEEEDDEEDEDEEEDDDDEYDPTIIQFEMLKNFFVDEDGTNVSTHLGSISKELRTLNKILLKKNKD